jgi:hypothetical protein
MPIEKIKSPINNLSDVPCKFRVSEEYEELEKKHKKRKELIRDKRRNKPDK